jgi:hypothetical protein
VHCWEVVGCLPCAASAGTRGARVENATATVARDAKSFFFIRVYLLIF